jgi:hypothetical protein
VRPNATRCAFALLSLVCTLAADTLKFEVASIKPADPNSEQSSASLDAGEGLEVRNITVRNLITLAYGLRDCQFIGAPGWTDKGGYDATAKAPASGVAPGAQESLDDRKARFERVRERLRSYWRIASRSPITRCATSLSTS